MYSAVNIDDIHFYRLLYIVLDMKAFKSSEVHV